MHKEHTVNMRTLIIMILSVLITSCATQQQAKIPAVRFVQIKFGSSGGFTGITNEYLLKQDGRVFKITSDSFNKINQINKPEINNINSEIAELGFENLNLQEKGNITYFIEVQTSNFNNKTTWTDQTQSDGVKQLYKNLVKTLK